jgi:hypothetical protein
VKRLFSQKCFVFNSNVKKETFILTTKCFYIRKKRKAYVAKYIILFLKPEIERMTN